MPESFVVFIHSLGECQQLGDALAAAGEHELAEQFLTPIEEPENVDEWGPLLSVDQMLELGDHLRDQHGERGAVWGQGRRQGGDDDE